MMGCVPHSRNRHRGGTAPSATTNLRMKVIRHFASFISPSPSSSRTSSFASRNMTSDGSCVACVEVPPTSSNGRPERRPDHHVNSSASLFKNPWPSFNADAVKDTTALKFLALDWRSVPNPPNLEEELKVMKPTWDSDPRDAGSLKATWLSHASFLLELPAPSTAKRGARVLFDPVFSEHCADRFAAFASFWKTRRRTAVPCQIEELEGVDVVLISHNHYDHMDVNTLRALQDEDIPPHFVVPLNNEGVLQDMHCDDDPALRVHSLDWWQSRIFTVHLPSRESTEITIPMSFEVTCVPSQHQSNRGINDRNHGLWCGYVVTSVTDTSRNAMRKRGEAFSMVLDDEHEPFSCFFAGDTGYGYVPPGKTEAPNVCPAFTQIGDRFNGFDLALLPIGAYDPRTFTSSVHSSPEDSVQIFKDVRARRAIAMHWGTFTLTNEPFLEPRNRLKAACEKNEIPEGVFTTCHIGEKVIVHCNIEPE